MWRKHFESKDYRLYYTSKQSEDDELNYALAMEIPFPLHKSINSDTVRVLQNEPLVLSEVMSTVRTTESNEERELYNDDETQVAFYVIDLKSWNMVMDVLHVDMIIYYVYGH